MMSSKDVIDHLLRRQKSERMGIKDSYWHETLMKWESEGHIRQTRPDPDRFYEERYDVDEVIPFDMASVGGYFDEMPLRGFCQVLDESDEWITTKNGGGATMRRWKNRNGVPEHIDFEMVSPEIWQEKYRPHLLELDVARLTVDHDREELARARANGKFAYYGHKLFWELQREMLGDLCMLENMLLEPEWIADFNEVYTQFYITHFKYLFEHAGVPDGVWFYEDIGYKNGLFCSPDTLRELFLPYYKRIVDFVHSYNIPVIFHSFGRIEKALPLIAEAGFDALNPIEIKAGCDLIRFAEAYKDQFTFIGGIDVRLLESGDRAAIKAEIERVCTALKQMGARYIFSSDHSISPSVEFDDFMYALDVFRQNMWY